MTRFIVSFFGIWLVLFILRVILIGGLDLNYRYTGNDLFYPVQSSLDLKIAEVVISPESALLSGMVLGSQHRLPKSLKKDLQSTSTIHMVVVSGQNLALLAGFLLSLVKVLGRRLTLVCIMFILLGYAFLTGFQIPVLRAVIMIGLSFTGQLLGRERLGWWILLLTAALMLLYQPNWLLSISFQLSFLATFAVIVVSPVLTALFKNFPEIIKQDLAVTLSAQILTLPVIAANFNQISIVGVLANLLVLWTIPLIMISGGLVVMTAYLNQVLASMVAVFPTVLLRYYIYVVAVCSSLPIASVYIVIDSVVFWLGYYLLLSAGFLWLIKRRISNPSLAIGYKD